MLDDEELSLLQRNQSDISCGELNMRISYSNKPLATQRAHSNFEPIIEEKPELNFNEGDTNELMQSQDLATEEESIIEKESAADYVESLVSKARTSVKISDNQKEEDLKEIDDMKLEIATNSRSGQLDMVEEQDEEDEQSIVVRMNEAALMR